MAAANQPFGFYSGPENAGNVYDIQTKQALAQALLQKGLQGNLSAYQPAGGGFAYVPSMGIGGALAGSVLPSILGSVLQKQANQELTALGQRQQASLMQMLSPQTVTMGGGAAVPTGSGVGAAMAVDSAGMPGGQALAEGLAAHTQTVTRASPLNPGNLDPRVAAMILSASPEKYYENVLAYNKPSEIVAQLRAANIDPNSALGHQVAQGRLAKENYIAQQGFAPGQTVINPMTGQERVIPNIGEGMEIVRRPDGSSYVAEIPGYSRTVGGISGARAGAEAGARAQFEPREVFNPATGQFELSTTANVAQAAGARTPFQQAQVMTESGGNPNAVSPKGAMGAWQVMPNTNKNPGFGVAPARDDSRAELDRVGREYSDAMLKRYNGNQQLGAIAYNMGPGATDAWLKKGARFEDLPRETKDYMGKVSLMTSMSQQQPQQQAAPSPMLSRAPLGAEAAAVSTEQGQVRQMDESFKEQRQVRSTGQNAITMLDDMTKYATSKSPVLANKLYNVQGVFSTDAQLFDKARSNLIAQVAGSTGMGTDQARAIVEGSIPNFGMSQAAIQEGLHQIKGQVQMRMLKSDYMSDAYAQKNAQQYNLRENQFDQVMTPNAANIIKMPPGKARNDAIMAAKQNPGDADALRWALTTGLLKK